MKQSLGQKSDLCKTGCHPNGGATGMGKPSYEEGLERSARSPGT